MSTRKKIRPIIEPDALGPGYDHSPPPELSLLTEGSTSINPAPDTVPKSTQPIDDVNTPAEPAVELVADSQAEPVQEPHKGDSSCIESLGEDEEEEEEEEAETSSEEEDEEPQLKTARLTGSLNAVYRNGDATSAFIVGGDQMIIGTHNGNIHVLELPTLASIRVYHAHSASVTAISASPFPPSRAEASAFPSVPAVLSSPIRRASSIASNTASTSTARTARPRGLAPVPVPNTPTNNIYIATSSTDGNVCIQSLLDPKDVQLRNFARPVQVVALSPEYKQDRTYISGGLAGNLIVTVGGSPGRSTSTTIGTAAATASGWLGSIGMGTSNGRDTIVHSGEGTIGAISWSRSGHYVAWVNEFGIKIMRSRIGVADVEEAWRRIGHVDRPATEEWETMAGVWKARMEWVDEDSFSEGPKDSKGPERLVVGWGGTIWIVHVHKGGMGTGRNVGEQIPAHAEIAKVLRTDCIISGLSFFSANQMLVLAFCRPEDSDSDDENQPLGEPTGGIKRRRVNNKHPELRLIDLESQVEVEKLGLIISRYERLSCNDYHLAVLPAEKRVHEPVAKGALEMVVGYGSEWVGAGMNMLSGTAASIRGSEDGQSVRAVPVVTVTKKAPAHPNLGKPGVKMFIHSPYDCVLATPRDLADHFVWLVEQQDYPGAWVVLEEHPTVLDGDEDEEERESVLSEHAKEDATATDVTSRTKTTHTSKEKRRIADLWLKSLIDQSSWAAAGKLLPKVLDTSDRWATWIFTFVNAGHFDDIAPHVPVTSMRPPIPSTCYEVILAHYIKTDKQRVHDLLEKWPVSLFDVPAVSKALEEQLKFRDVREDAVENGVRGRDWGIVVGCLAKLHEADGRDKEALRCYIKLQDAENAFRVIREKHLAGAVGEDIVGFFNLRSRKNSSRVELEIETKEAVLILVEEAVSGGFVNPDVVIKQLMDNNLKLYTFFYLRGLWNAGEPDDGEAADNRKAANGKALLEPFADLVVELFATFDRPILLPFLRHSTGYQYTNAVYECEKRNFADELVFLYSKTGEPRKALFLIIERLGDVGKAIAFAKEQNDPEIWEDLLSYGMDKPRFIRGLLGEVGGCVEPIKLVQRIPEGLEIEGLKEGVGGLLREYEVMGSVVGGAAAVLRGEVNGWMSKLREGRRRAVKFEVPSAEDEPTDLPTPPPEKRDIFGNIIETPTAPASFIIHPGHCAGCQEPFSEEEMETIIGFRCGHVWHVRHLLEKEGQPMNRREREICGGFGGGEGGLVGSKVTHARLLRGRVAGCEACK